MPCFAPLKAFRPLSNQEGGRLVFNSKHALNPTNPVTVPCGVCIGCRVDRSRDWAARCMHEAQMHPSSSFISPTYDDEHLPENYSVSLRDLQLFMKKLRSSVPQKIRYFASAEYGDLTLRPHYHLLIFNHAFPDKTPYKKSPQGHQLYTSKSLEKLWPQGLCLIGDVTYQTAAYTARYIMKKITGERAADHYVRRHPLTNTVHLVEPEFCVQSRRPGIGASWFDKYKTDAFPSDFIIVDGKKHPVPKFYAKKLSEEEAQPIIRRRKKNSLGRKADNTPRRLRDREAVKQSQLNRLKRDLL